MLQNLLFLFSFSRMFMWIKELSFTENNFSPSFNKKRKVTFSEANVFGTRKVRNHRNSFWIWKNVELFKARLELIVNKKEITHQNKIENELLFFYEALFRNTSANTSEDCESFLNEFFVPKLNDKDARICWCGLNELELLKAFKSV